MLRSLTARILVACTCLAPPLAAQDGEQVAAEALFMAGRDAAKAGDHETACEKFRESQRLQPAPGTLLNIGICEEALGRLASAWQRYREVLSQLPSSDPRRPIAEERSEELDARLPRVIVRLADDAPRDTTVTLDGTELTRASFGLPLPVDPGKRSLRVAAPRHETNTISIDLAEGDRKEVTASPGKALRSDPPPGSTAKVRPPNVRPAPEGKSPDVAEKPEGGSARRIVGWTLVGVGVGGLAATSGLAAVVANRKQTVNAGCDDSSPRRCTDEALGAADEGRRASAAATATFAIGLAGLGAGLFLVLKSPKKEVASIGVAPTRSGAAFRMGYRF